MKNLLKQSTAKTVRLGPFVDSTDGVTAETALTISQADIRLSKEGAAFAQTNNATGATHDENGWYSVPLDTTDTNTLGSLTVTIRETGALPVFKDFEVVTVNVFNSLVAGSANLAVDAVAISGDSTAADNLELAADGTGYNLGSGAIVSASVTGNVGGNVTGNVGGNVTGSIGSLATQAKADVNAEADTALADYDAPTNAEMVARTILSADYATSSALDAVDNFIDTEVAAIKAKTDNLPGSPAATGDAMTLAASTDTYWATVDITIDDATSTDEYTITWFKNGIRQTSGITSPLIQVVKRSDGTDLISSTAMTQIGTTGSYKYDAITTARLTAGEAAIAVVSATIDASGRSFSKLVSRDSA